ncbi:DUF262 domain-containing protein [Nonomuraea sp. NPDC004580]|uniref:DUF262 domain-containing protein n=1 Tax=Nonomuraea sp. NPDC004580 TaxID=3154552 RepID=UPI0033AA5419
MAAVTRPKVCRPSLSELVDLARRGRIRIPASPASRQWGRDDVTRLFDSVLHGYPMGNVLVWQRPAPSGSVVIGPLVIEAEAVGDAFWVVDGRQRLAALVGALTATADTVDPRFRIHFDLATGEFVALSRREEPGDGRLPMALVLDAAETDAWFRANTYLSRAQRALAEQVVEAVRDYRIPLYVVTGQDDRPVREIYARINTPGKPSDSAEVLHTLRSITDEQKPGDLRTLRASVRTFGFGDLPEELLVRSVLASRNSRDIEGGFRDEDDRRAAFARTETALGHVVDYLRDEADIPHVKLVPRPQCIPVLARFTATFGPPGGRAADLLRRWIWRGAVLGVTRHGHLEEATHLAEQVHTHPVDSAQRLIESLPTPLAPWKPDLTRIGLDHPQAKVNILSLLALGPRCLTRPGAPIDAVKLLAARIPLVPIVDDRSGLGSGLANHLIQPSEEAGPLAGLLVRLDLDETVLAGHCLDAESIELLRRGRTAAFLERRAYKAETVIHRHVQNRALFGFRDGPDLATLFDEDDELD